MRGYFAVNTISEEERSNILSQHKTLYNGYQTMNPEIPNTQPLYVQDFAKDKVGAVMGNKGNIKGYTNMGINEQVEEQSFPYDKPIVSEGECSECGGTMMEGECSECGWKGNMDEHAEDGDPQYTRLEEGECSECGGMMEEGVCNECGYGSMEEETGHLDDIYHEEDLDPNAEFDYVKGASNKTNAFHVKEQMMKTPIGKISAIGGMKEKSELEELSTHELEKGKKYKYNLPSFDDEVEFDDEFEDKSGGEKMYMFKGRKDSMSHLMPGKHIETYIDNIEEQGGNADDMDVDDVQPAYNFDSDGPMDGGDVYPVNEYDDQESFDELINMDSAIEDERDNLEQEGYEQMESAFADEMDEVDISGSQGVYGDMDPAYDFDSEGPGKGGPYQEYHGETVSGDDDELEVNFDEFDPRDKSWEEITQHTGDDEFGYVDEDIRESLIIQKNRIMEMMNRMKVIK